MALMPRPQEPIRQPMTAAAAAAIMAEIGFGPRKFGEENETAR